MTAGEIWADVQRNWMLYAAMPLVAAGIGYVTKLLAIKMMFAPIEFVGIRPFFGWQGIVPRKAEFMAKTACDTLMKNLIDPAEIWSRVDAQRLVAELEKPMLETVERITHEVAARYQPSLWQSLGPKIQQRVISQVQKEAPAVVKSILDDIGRNITKVIDLEAMIIRALTHDKRVIIRIFKETGREEFAFIRRSGIWFGLGIGLVQALTWALTHSPWVMPLFGGFVGYASDWVALRMVFRPVEPTRFFGVFTWQGLFLKRRAEVSEIHARLIAEEVLTARNLLESAITGPSADQLYALVSKHVQTLIDEQAGIVRPLVVLAMGGERYQQMKNEIAAKLMGHLPATLSHAEAFMDRELDMRTTLASKMKMMTAEQFEGVLRPVFRQDEWILVLLGGVLGFLVGELQVYVMLHH